MSTTGERGLGLLFRTRLIGVAVVGPFLVVAAVLTREPSWIFAASMAVAALTLMALRLRRTRRVPDGPEGAPHPLHG